jgi:hypothetical protein
MSNSVIIDWSSVVSTLGVNSNSIEATEFFFFFGIVYDDLNGFVDTLAIAEVHLWVAMWSYWIVCVMIGVMTCNAERDTKDEQSHAKVGKGREISFREDKKQYRERQRDIVS